MVVKDEMVGQKTIVGGQGGKTIPKQPKKLA